jgi:hypothetical protein
MTQQDMVATAPQDRSGWQLSAVIAEAIAIEMRRDPAVLCIGEDIGRAGGVFGATRGLQAEFGTARVMDAPITEMGFSGMGVGLAQAGMRPLVEIMFVDFIGVCLEQVFNAAAKIPYMSGGRQKMPMVFKTAGGCIGSAAQHSQCLWGTFAHLPGLRVVAPSNPFDYRGLMASAIRSDDPVVFIEHKGQLLKKVADFHNSTPVPDRQGLGCHAGDDFGLGRARAGGRRHPCRRGHFGRGDRPAHRHAARQSDGGGFRRAYRASACRRRGLSEFRPQRRALRPGDRACRAGLFAPDGTAGPARRAGSRGARAGTRGRAGGFGHSRAAAPHGAGGLGWQRHSS